MAMLFRRRKPAGPSPEMSGELAETVRRLLDLEEDAAVSVNELHCGHNACGVETVILVMRPGRRTEAFKIAMPVEKVSRPDLIDALHRA